MIYHKILLLLLQYLFIYTNMVYFNCYLSYEKHEDYLRKLSKLHQVIQFGPNMIFNSINLNWIQDIIELSYSGLNRIELDCPHVWLIFLNLDLITTDLRHHLLYDTGFLDPIIIIPLQCYLVTLYFLHFLVCGTL